MEPHSAELRSHVLAAWDTNKQTNSSRGIAVQGFRIVISTDQATTSRDGASDP
jgi:hypothetical protein